MGALRVYLAMSVVFWHIKDGASGRTVLLDPGLAISSFFIISGFYMTMVLTERYGRTSDGRIRFVLNRLLRIFPLYLVVLLLQQLDYLWLGVPTVFTSSMGLQFSTRALLIFMNLFKFGQDWWQTLVEQYQYIRQNSIIDPTPGISLWAESTFGINALRIDPGYILIGQGWSLASELTFYLLAPLLVFKRTRWISLGIFVCLMIRLFFAQYIVGTVEHGAWFGPPLRAKFFPSQLVFFLIGQMSYLFYLRVKDHSKSVAIGQLLLWVYGRARAAKLAAFFADPQFGTIAGIYAMAPKDVGGSLRAIQTVAPLAATLNITVNQDFTRKKTGKLARAILANPDLNDKTVVIAWEHQFIPDIVAAFGWSGDVGKWSGDVYDRVWILDFVGNTVTSFEDIPQHLMPGDSEK